MENEKPWENCGIYAGPEGVFVNEGVICKGLTLSGGAPLSVNGGKLDTVNTTGPTIIGPNSEVRNLNYTDHASSTGLHGIHLRSGPACIVVTDTMQITIGLHCISASGSFKVSRKRKTARRSGG
jgi:hypothetical protein